MVNRKGFTLIEVILVVLIMSILLLILVPNVFVLVKKNNVKSCENLKESILTAAKTYVTNNKYQLGFSCEAPKNITIATLLTSGDLEGDKIINPINDEEITNDVVVTYNCDSNTFTYSIDINCES